MPVKSRTIRVGGYAPQDSVHSRAVDKFAAEVDARTNGEAEVDIMYNVMDTGKPATALFDMLEAGELTWCYYSSSYLGSRVPELNALEVPFLFDSVGDAHGSLDGDFGSALGDAVRSRAGYEVLGFWDNGLRHLTNSARTIRSPEDCKGLRIRLQPNAIHEALTASWGMSPVSAELSAGIEMIKRGEVDAQENPLANTVAYGVDHQHITLSAHLYGARGLFANPDEMSSLGELGDVVRGAATAAIAYQREAAAAYELELRQRLEAEGRSIIDLTTAERKAFADAAHEVIDNARSSIEPELATLLP
ncbi:MAG: TRAP-type C4-dicarboxylate transport system substrate-binding protein [Verrucomicrobiales bacterium]|jgi:TRAP-type C4-dicarboxylate transport system substrate-binding protein